MKNILIFISLALLIVGSAIGVFYFPAILLSNLFNTSLSTAAIALLLFGAFCCKFFLKFLVVILGEVAEW